MSFTRRSFLLGAGTIITASFVKEVATAVAQLVAGAAAIESADGGGIGTHRAANAADRCIWKAPGV